MQVIFRIFAVENLFEFFYDLLMKKLKLDVAARIYQARIEQDLTQEKLALISKVSHDTISRIESGETGSNYIKLYKICKALNIKMADLFQGY